ncbi:hypothetical protein [Joostella sp.]|uniref:hypothetical protein n=1 Tax=Joostella sp. TaxID=2231138 RepID=UPI003A8F0978
MKYFEYLINFPTLFFILLVILIIMNKEKLSFLLPNNEKLLEKLLKSKEVSNQRSKNLDEFLDNEIQKINFSNATGLTYTKKNEKLILHYKKLENEISWRDFRKISKHITEFESPSLIGSKKVIRDYKKRMSLWGGLFVLSTISFGILVFKNSNVEMTLLKLNQLALPIITFGTCQICFLNEKYKLKLVKQYDKIIEKIHIPDNV